MYKCLEPLFIIMEYSRLFINVPLTVDFFFYYFFSNVSNPLFFFFKMKIAVCQYEIRQLFKKKKTNIYINIYFEAIVEKKMLQRRSFSS